MSENNTPISLSRRDFLSTGIKGITGMAFLGALSSQAFGARGNIDKPNYLKTQHERYTLPALPYGYGALEPVIDEQTMRLHHDVHFNGYVKGVNKALDRLAELRSSGEYELVSHWQNQLAFHGAGMVLHTVFFENMAPQGTVEMSGRLGDMLTQAFGSVEGFQGQFAAAAGQVQGSGWGLLGYQPFGDRLLVLQVEKHQNFTQWGVVPILALDVWEHAYYLRYQNKRGDYIKNWWSIVNWRDVESRIEHARQAQAEAMGR